MEEAFLYTSRSSMEKPYRLALKILPDPVAMKLCERLVNRSYMQFESQNRFLAKWGKSLETFLHSEAFKSMPLNDRKIVVEGFLETAGLYQCIEDGLQREEVVFFEEGLIQKSFMFLPGSNEKGVDQASAIRYLENIPMPGAIVCVKVDTGLCYDRMQGRRKGLIGRLKGWEMGAIFAFLERAEAFLAVVASWLSQKSTVHLIEVCNNNELTEVVEKIAGQLNFSRLGCMGDTADETCFSGDKRTNCRE
jgi:hypothetical protein